MTLSEDHACIVQEVRRLRYGKTVDLAVLYETYSDLLFRVALTYVRHMEDAQDIVHDVFATFMAKQPSFRDSSHERAWMLRVTIHKCHDLQRRQVVRRYTPLEEAQHLTATENMEASELLSAVQSLPDKLHAVVVLHYLEGFSVEETAQCLRISVSAVKMRLARGRQMIKGTLGTEE